MRSLLVAEVEVDVPAEALWDYLVDWPRQGEWIPLTRVERADPADPALGVGGRLRAWTGLGPVGFWDDMTITAWERRPDGGGVCEVLHTGKVVKGEGVFEVRGDGAGASRFGWSEIVSVPGGSLGALLWRVARPLLERYALGAALGRLKRRAEASAA